MHVSALFRYPVKSLRGLSLERAHVEPIGLEGDRRWMIVDPSGRFLTRREIPRMAEIEVDLTGDGIALSHPEAGRVTVAIPTARPAKTVKIWRDTVTAHVADAEAGAFLTGVLGRPVELVHKPDANVRPVDPAFAAPTDAVAFADGFPLLVTTEASLEALNERLATSVSMMRFRPNIVVSGAEAWAEDHWRRIRIGNLVLRVVKPCARCIITTQDPLTGATVDRNEPLTTLRKMGRMTKSGIMFGQNAIPDGAADISVGQAVEVLEDDSAAQGVGTG